MALLERTDITSPGAGSTRPHTRACDGVSCPGDMMVRPPGRVVWMRDGVLDSAELFELGRTVRILHDGQVYVLRLTSNNKLILTK